MNLFLEDWGHTSHVVGDKLSIALPRRQNHIIVSSIAKEANLTDGASMSIRQGLDCLSRVDVPNGHIARSVSRDTQTLLPCELDHSILVHIKKSLGAFNLVK